MIVSLILNLCFVPSAVQADGVGFVKPTEIKVSHELKDVVSSTKYVKGLTKAKEWKKNKEMRYEYPIDCDNKIWKQYKDHMQMIEACNVPDEILSDASTEEVLNLVLDYPLLCDVFAYNNIESGINALARQSNVFGELLKRKDVSQTVFKEYVEVGIEEGTSDLEENFDKVSKVVILESLLAQNQLIDGLTAEQQVVLDRTIKQNVIKKMNTSLFMSNTTTFYDISDKNGVAERLNLKRNVNLISPSVVSTSSSLYVKTPNGTKVAVLQNSYKGSSWASSLDRQYKSAYPLATFLASSDNRYNCHSYAWYSASTSNRYWMNSPKAYVNDKSYISVGQKPTAASQRVVYKNQTVPFDDWIHSGITVNTSGTVKSKWGQAPLFKHALGYCPYFQQYNVVHYYKRN